MNTEFVKTAETLAEELANKLTKLCKWFYIRNINPAEVIIEFVDNDKNTIGSMFHGNLADINELPLDVNHISKDEILYYLPTYNLIVLSELAGINIYDKNNDNCTNRPIHLVYEDDYLTDGTLCIKF